MSLLKKMIKIFLLVIFLYPAATFAQMECLRPNIDVEISISPLLSCAHIFSNSCCYRTPCSLDLTLLNKCSKSLIYIDSDGDEEVLNPGEERIIEKDVSGSIGFSWTREMYFESDTRSIYSISLKTISSAYASFLYKKKYRDCYRLNKSDDRYVQCLNRSLAEVDNWLTKIQYVVMNNSSYILYAAVLLAVILTVRYKHT